MRALRTCPGVADTKIICGASCSHSSNFSGRLSSARRQAEAVFHQRLLARAVALVHGAELRNGLVRFVDDQQRVPRQVVEQARRRLARRAAGQIARVVLDAGAVADLFHHLHVEHGALLEALRLDQLVLLAQHLEPLAQFLADVVDGADAARSFGVT